PSCDDAISCTLDACSEGLKSCTHTTNDGACNDGLFCNGVETCNATTGCVAGTPPCDDGVACTVDTSDEASDTCQFTPNDAPCDNGSFCDGAEKCTQSGCAAGTPPCAAGTTCIEQTDTCCTPESDGAFCARLGDNCGTVTAADNCGVTRTVA